MEEEDECQESRQESFLHVLYAPFEWGVFLTLEGVYVVVCSMCVMCSPAARVSISGYVIFIFFQGLTFLMCWLVWLVYAHGSLPRDEQEYAGASGA
ncbi:hypothetical protein Krac_3937 [Ktedonobacter racemifer DSM 44963]|uniref:Uncharacterized protein n=1 Tax=Ktedonobacter racemifer DSM 44963 TaxID=485913 RepID=D6U3N6_KTERA|nr:hypothetical protein Krac_3937 [Ktedonobacter racemifer DSM 44963]